VTDLELISVTIAPQLCVSIAPVRRQWEMSMNAIVMDTSNVRLARAIRQVQGLREASWTGENYGKSYSDCISEVVGNDPIGIILRCLFTAGYCDMFQVADKVLG
jgi:hypothetical protein